MVDHESESCGCPPVPVVSVASAGAVSNEAARPGHVVGGPSSTPADTDFPLAQSEGLAPTPKPTDPPPNSATTRINVPLVYNGEAPPPNTPSPIPPYNPDEPMPAAKPKPAPVVTARATPPPAPAPARTSPPPRAAVPSPTPVIATAPAPPPRPVAKAQHEHSDGVFHRIGHFFAKIFGA